MKELLISYTTWKQVTSNSNLQLYHIIDGYESAEILCGYSEFIFKALINSENYSDWFSNYQQNSLLVPSLDDAIALIVSKNPLVERPVTSSGHSIMHLDAPTEPDGKQVYVMSPSTEGLYTWLTARGDDLNPVFPSYGRGEGNQLTLFWDGYEEEDVKKEVVLDWIEPIELHDGHVNFPPNDWGFEDEWNFFVRIPANTPILNQDNTGNCNLIEIPDTGNTLHIIVPAMGDGTHDIDLSKAIPSPCGKMEYGYWNLVSKWTEEIEPNKEPIIGSWNLYDFQIEIYFMKNLNCGDPRGMWELDAYKAEWICSKWKLVFSCSRRSPGPGKIGGDIMVFRPGAL